MLRTCSTGSRRSWAWHDSVNRSGCAPRNLRRRLLRRGHSGRIYGIRREPRHCRGSFALYCNFQNDIVPQHIDLRSSSTTARAPPKSANPNVERCSDFAYSAPPAQYDPNLILWDGIRIVVFIYFARRLAERKAWSAGKAAMADEIRRNRAAASGLAFIHPEKCAVIR